MGTSRDKRRKKRKTQKNPKIDNLLGEVRPREPSIDASISPSQYKKETPVWRISKIDNESKWGWSTIETQACCGLIIKHLSDRETMTWGEIEAQKSDKGKSSNHEIKVIDIIKEAQDRLYTINEQDTDTLFSIRVNNKIRIWGIRKGRVFHILWFDLKHEICPANRS